MTKRVLFFDVARALSILWIVCVWHPIDYISWEWEWAFRYVTVDITLIALACFTFISGFFLGKKKISALTFYKNRTRRFLLPLFFSALCQSVIGWFNSIWQFIFTITGLSCFILPQPGTLWYMAMLIIFYALTPPLLYNLEDKRWKIIVRAGVIYIIFFILYKLGYCDERMLMYFPFYVAGMYFTMDKIIKYVTSTRMLVSSMCIFTVTYILSMAYKVGGGQWQ